MAAAAPPRSAWSRQVAPVRARAKAQAEANRQLAQSLTPELIRYQQLQRWDGKLPLFSGGGVAPLIDATSIISGTSGR